MTKNEAIKLFNSFIIQDCLKNSDWNSNYQNITNIQLKNVRDTIIDELPNLLVKIKNTEDLYLWYQLSTYFVIKKKPSALKSKI